MLITTAPVSWLGDSALQGLADFTWSCLASLYFVRVVGLIS